MCSMSEVSTCGMNLAAEHEGHHKGFDHDSMQHCKVESGRSLQLAIRHYTGSLGIACEKLCI